MGTRDVPVQVYPELGKLLGVELGVDYIPYRTAPRTGVELFE